MSKTWLALLFCLAPCGCLGAGEARMAETTAASQSISESGRVPLVTIIPDGMESANRGFHGFNNVIGEFIMDPLTKVYRLILPTPVRKSIRKAGYNIAYPVRLINTLLQAKFKGAGVETERFGINTTVGVLGFFDPATHWGIRTYEEDFGLTFAHWGMGWGSYFEIPLFGPSSLRDALAAPLDGLANPAGWVYADNVFLINELSFTIPELKRIDTAAPDAYALERDYWALERLRKFKGLDEVPAKPGPPAEGPIDPTLNAIFMQPKDSQYFRRMKERSVPIAATGQKLPYSFRIQKQPAPMVYLVDGIGVHRLDESEMMLAEMFWDRGFSTVAISSPMSWEFIEKAGSHAVPGYTPVDARDLYAALNAIHQDLNQKYPNRITANALVGLSLGGLEALSVAELERTRPGGLRLDRIVAVDPPVDLHYALSQVDDYRRAVLTWPADTRQERMLMTLLKADKVLDPERKDKSPVPFTGTESRYLIGTYYRWILRDIIYASQRKKNLGILHASLGGWDRQPTYEAIERDYSYEAYLNQFVLPYYRRQTETAGMSDAAVIHRAGMWPLEAELKNDPRIRVFANQDDFLLNRGDLDWMRARLNGRLTVYPTGGHVGNLHQPAVQADLIGSLADLKGSLARNAAK